MPYVYKTHSIASIHRVPCCKNAFGVGVMLAWQGNDRTSKAPFSYHHKFVLALNHTCTVSVVRL